MTVIPSGPISLPLSYGRAHLAASANFQTLVGAADEAAALDSIHVLVAPAAYTRPCAVVEWAPDLHWTMSSRGVRNYYDMAGSIQIILEQAITSAVEADAAYTFGNAAGAIVSDMLAIAGTAGYLDIDDLRLVGPLRPAEAEQLTAAEDFYQAFLIIDYKGVG